MLVKHLDVLVRELPLLFAVKNLDFSILSSQITVINGNQPHSLVVSKEVYITAIRAIQMASTRFLKLSISTPTKN